MILRVEHGRLRIALQTDHAQIAGEFAGAWGGNRFAHPEPLGPVRLAAEMHDHGWSDWESEPQVNAESGRPYDFRTLPPDVHVGIYEQGIRAVVERHPYAGLLVSLHGTGLYKRRYGYMPDLTFKEIDPAHRSDVDRYLAGQELLQRDLMADLRPDEQSLWTHYRWLQIWDLLSLRLCLGDPAERRTFSVGVVPRFPGGTEDRIVVRGTGPGTYCVTPWPFAGRTVEVLIPVRYVDDRHYSSDSDFQAAFQAAPTEPIALTLQPC